MPTSLYQSPLWNSKNSSYERRERSWTNTPSYYTLPRADLPVNPYSDRRTVIGQYSGLGAYSMRASDGFIYGYDLAKGYPLTGAEIFAGFNTALNSSNFSAVANSAANDLTVKLLGDIADTKTNLAVMAAEASKTSDLIYNAAKRIDRAWRAFRKGNFRAVARELNLPLGRVHNTWLEYKYGWIPVLLDAKSAAEFFAQQSLGGRPIRFSVNRTSKVPFSWNRTVTYSPVYGGGGSSTYTETLIGNYVVRRKIWCEVTNPRLNQLQQLGLTNPALAAWEKIPYSFVFDWFCSVGDYLVGISALHGVTIRRTLHSNVNEIQYRYKQPATSYTNSGGTVYYNDLRERWVTERWYGRNTFSVDPASLSIPKQVPDSLSKLVTSLALLRGANRSVRI
jgi:hypothetical protein